MNGSSGGSLVEAAFRSLRRDIIQGGWAPEERLRLERLRKAYGIGPTPMREALQRLHAEGLVVAEGNRGFSVAPLDLAEFQDLNEARIEVELSALRRAILRGDEDWEAALVAAAWRVRKADEALLGGDEPLERWEVANAAFHTSAVAACGSSWLLRVRALLQDQCARFRLASVAARRPVRDLRSEHAAIAEAALARDTETACRLTAEHYARTAADLSSLTPIPESEKDGAGHPLGHH